MSEKEYIVTLNKGVDYAQFNQEMIASTGSGDIPNRTVDIADARPLSTRNTHYALSDEEAVELRNDNRVTDVQLRPQDRDDIEIGRDGLQEATFTKLTSDTGNYRDWVKLDIATQIKNIQVHQLIKIFHMLWTEQELMLLFKIVVCK